MSNVIFSMVVIVILYILTSSVNASAGDNYEWKPPEMVDTSEPLHQEPSRLFKDPVDGCVYLSYCVYNSSWTTNPERVIVSRFNSTLRAFEFYVEFQVPINSLLYGTMAYNGTISFLFYEFRPDAYYLYKENGTEKHYLFNYYDKKYMGEDFPYGSPQSWFLDVEGDTILFLRQWVTHDDYSPPYTLLWLYRINISTLEIRVEEILDLDYIFRGVMVQHDDDKLWLVPWRLWTRSEEEYLDFYFGIYDLTSSRLQFLKPLLNATPINDYWSDWGMEIDASSRLHLIFNGAITTQVITFSQEGALVAERSTRTLLTYFWTGVNNTGGLYVIGNEPVNESSSLIRMTVWIFPADLNSKPYSVYLMDSRDSLPYGVFCVNSTGDVILAWVESYSFFNRIHYTCQTPLAPDLTIDADSVRVHQSSLPDRIVSIGFQVSNMGRGRCRGFTLSAFRVLDNGTRLPVVVYDESERLVEPGMVLDYSFAGRCPRGSNHFLILIEDVRPFEHRVDNNLRELWTYVPYNSPPTLKVILPENGTVTAGSMELSGITDDIDGIANVTTSVHGMPGLDIIIEGIGPWSRMFQLDTVPSGDYVLVFEASDDEDYSNREIRTVRIDRLNDTLIVESCYPEGDMGMLVGETVGFLFNVRDIFARPLAFRWSLNSGLVPNDFSSFVFIAEQEGVYRLEVAVTNGFMQVSHSWTITVRRIVPPHITAYMPGEANLTVLKSAVQGFGVNVQSPDGIPFSVYWLYDEVELGGKDPFNRTVEFNTSGGHLVTVYLMSRCGSERVQWAVNVVNRPPIITSTYPANHTISIDNATETEFHIGAMDPDGDALVYRWTSSVASFVAGDTSSCVAHCPYLANVTYVIAVQVSDGDDAVFSEWTIESKKIDVPVESPDVPLDDGDIPEKDVPTKQPRHDPFMLWIMAVVIIVLVVAFAILYTRRASRKPGSERK